MSNVQKSGNQSTNYQANRDINQVKNYLNTIQIVLNLQGKGDIESLGDGLSKLKNLDTGLPSVQEIDIDNLTNQINEVLSKSAEMMVDLSALAEVLEPAIEKMDSQKGFLPEEFLSCLVSAIGEQLDKVEIFSSKFAINKSNMGSEIPSEIPMRAIAKVLRSYPLDAGESQDEPYYIGIVQTLEYYSQLEIIPKQGWFGKETKRSIVVPIKKYTLINNLGLRDESIITKYHLLLERIGLSRPKEITLSANMLAKITMALLKDYLTYIRYSKGTEVFVNSIKT